MESLEEDSELLARIKNFDSEDEDDAQGQGETGNLDFKSEEFSTLATLSDSSEVDELHETIENFFDLCDEDGDGFIFDDDADIFKERVRMHDANRYRPLLKWLTLMPKETIRNLSKAMFLEDVRVALKKYCDNDKEKFPEKAVDILNILMELVAESMEMEEKIREEYSEEPMSDLEAASDGEPVNDEASNMSELEITGECVSPLPPPVVNKADPGKRIVTEAEAKKDPVRSPSTRIPDMKPEKKPFKAKRISSKRKRKTVVPEVDKVSPPVVRKRNDGPRDVERSTGWKPAKYDNKPTNRRSKSLGQALETKQKKKKKKPKLEEGQAWVSRYEYTSSDQDIDIIQLSGWRRAKYELPKEQGIYPHRGLRKSITVGYLPRKEGPQEIGRTRGWRRAKYEVDDGEKGISTMKPRIRRPEPITFRVIERKTGPREESRPDGWKPPPKEWARAFDLPPSPWVPKSFTTVNFRAKSLPNPRRKRKTRKPIPASMSNPAYSAESTSSLKPGTPKKRRTKSVNFADELQAYSPEPVTIKRKKKVESEVPEFSSAPVLKPRKRAGLEDIQFGEDENIEDMASDPIEDFEAGEIVLTDAEGEGSTTI